MGYHTRADLPYHYALADAFTLCDGYHASVLGPTHPNRLMAMSGTIDPAGLHGGPVLTTNADPGAKFSVSWPTMPEVLEDAHVSWKVYTPPGDAYRVDNAEVMAISDAVLPYFSQYSDPSSALHRKAFLPIFPNDFAADVRAGALPAVSWIIPPLGYDEHPPAPPALGAWFIDQVLSTLTSRIPRCGPRRSCSSCTTRTTDSSTTSPRPSRRPGTAGEYVTVRPLPADAAGVAGPDRPRVPGPDAGRLAVQPRRAHLARRRSTTRRSCGSSRSGSGSPPRTCPPGGAPPSATSPRPSRWATR